MSLIFRWYRRRSLAVSVFKSMYAHRITMKTNKNTRNYNL